jgi:hypothetical protein
LRLWVFRPLTRAYVRLLGPCFKTGRTGGRLGRRGRLNVGRVDGDIGKRPRAERAPASRYRTTGRVSAARRAFYADVFIKYSLDALFIDPTIETERAGYEYPRRAFDLNSTASSAVRIGRGANPREMRLTNATTRRLEPDFYAPTIETRSRVVRLIPEGVRRFRPFSSKRFHALLNSLFKVLFNFPSRYLFAIGLAVVFSLRRGLPSALGYTLK